MAKTMWNAYIRSEDESAINAVVAAELKRTAQQFLVLALDSLELLGEFDEEGPTSECQLLAKLLKEEDR